jgi:hypothetical protein
LPVARKQSYRISSCFPGAVPVLYDGRRDLALDADNGNKTVNYRPTATFSISASETWDRFRLPLANGNFSVVLASLQGNYSFTRFLMFTSLVQVDTSNTQAVSANVRLRYNYRPDSDLYIIYNVGTQFASIALANPPQVRETRFAVRWTSGFAPRNSSFAVSNGPSSRAGELSTEDIDRPSRRCDFQPDVNPRPSDYWLKLAGATRLEPANSCVTGRRSNH